jgi:3D (Asp-Asp-Asp) domain-containing protein
MCSLVVEASAFNSVRDQTDGHPQIAAWGARLEPGMRAVAVSRDLLEVGLDDGAEVWIEGLPGTYVVRDKMGKRWKRKVDIYFGNDVEAARDWGVRNLEIRWPAPEGEVARCP